MADGWLEDEDNASMALAAQLAEAKIRDNSYTCHENSIEIPTVKVGRVIGRGGNKIRELENSSGARIKIIKAREGATRTMVNLSGSPAAKSKVKELIIELIVDRPYSRRNGSTNNSTRCSENQPSTSTANNSTWCSENQPSTSTANNSTWCSEDQPSTSTTNSTPTASCSSSNNNGNDEDGVNTWNWAAMIERNKRTQEAHWATLPPILKDFYVEHPEVAAMSERDVSEWREQCNNITIERIKEQGENMPDNLPNPVCTFEQAFQAYPGILKVISEQGFKTPSPIQSQAWPVLLKGNDLIGIAQTGTGKTLAFLLPAFIHIDRQPVPVEDREGPNVLVLAPTRELAIQINKEVKKYEYKGYKSVCIYGGASKSDQIETISKGVQIVIATPGRLNDLVKAKQINIEAVTYLVLDEADRMLDLGFGPQIRVSLFAIRPTRQTIMTSATWNNEVQRLAEMYTKNPVRVIVGSLDLAAVHSVKQTLVFIDDYVEDKFIEKFNILMDFLNNLEKEDKVIIFCTTKATTIRLATDVACRGVHIQTIYGSLDQYDREQAIEDMMDGTIRVLIATDVASRGIDIGDVTHIINFDFPTNLEEFVHRVGRSGRAGKTGKAITYLTRKDWDKAEGLIAILEEADQFVPRELIAMAERYRNRPKKGRGRGRGGNRGHFSAFD